MTPRKVALAVGTRPEAIKMAPVLRALEASSTFRPVLVSTGQHRELLETAFQPLEMTPDRRLDVMEDDQTLNGLIVRVVDRLSHLLESLEPAALLVEGDTTSVLASALAAYSLRIPVGHVEAGLRTYVHENPFPEEANRQLVDRLSTWCFAPTEGSRENLLAERIDARRVYVTGNTVVDSLLWAVERSKYRCPEETVLVTLHRRESFGRPLQEILLGLSDFLHATPKARALWPVHPNPNVGAALEVLAGRRERIDLVAPMDYLRFAGALASCRLVLTDSGGLQEEGPSLGKPVLVAREVTERPEAFSPGRNRIVGRRRNSVLDGLRAAWTEPAYAGPLPAPNPYGNGQAGKCIAEILERTLAG